MQSALKNSWRFASKRHDIETGFLFFGRRYYLPSVGRFLTPDPVGFTDGPNLYAYVHNSPMTLVDPYGLTAIENTPLRRDRYCWTYPKADCYSNRSCCATCSCW